MRVIKTFKSCLLGSGLPLFVTMMNRLGLPSESFVDSTGEMTEVVG